MPNSNPSIATSRSSSRHRMIEWFHLHQERLWWLHSFYALILGICIMWLGKRNFSFLRLFVFHISFIWLSSLLLPKLLNRPGVPARWAPRLQLLVNFFNKNLYQQMLFFVLPIYYASATFGSPNIVFVLLVAMSATLSTLDVVYDRPFLSKSKKKWEVLALIPSYTAFRWLPILWSVSN